jgi:hypothetical protein
MIHHGERRTFAIAGARLGVAVQRGGSGRAGEGQVARGAPILGYGERAPRRIVEDGPIPTIHGVVRWRIVDLMQWLWVEFGLSVSKQTMSNELRVWFHDETRIGQENKIGRRWARRGTRPIAPRDQRICSAYVFGAICPAAGKGAALVLPRCTTVAMTFIWPGDLPGRCHRRPRFRPARSTGWQQRQACRARQHHLLSLSAKSPELNPVDGLRDWAHRL